VPLLLTLFLVPSGTELRITRPRSFIHRPFFADITVTVLYVSASVGFGSVRLVLFLSMSFIGLQSFLAHVFSLLSCLALRPLFHRRHNPMGTSVSIFWRCPAP